MDEKRTRLAIVNGDILRICPELAKEIGLNESMILLQIDFWIQTSKGDIFHDNRYWTYQSIRDIQRKKFPFWSIATINRAIKALINKGYLIEGNYNNKSYDKTRWFAIDYGKLLKLESVNILEGDETRSNQNETPSAQNETPSAQNETTIPESTTESTTENIEERDGKKSKKKTSLPKKTVEPKDEIYYPTEKEWIDYYYEYAKKFYNGKFKVNEIIAQSLAKKDYDYWDKTAKWTRGSARKKQPVKDWKRTCQNAVLSANIRLRGHGSYNKNSNVYRDRDENGEIIKHGDIF